MSKNNRIVQILAVILALLMLVPTIFGAIQ